MKKNGAAEYRSQNEQVNGKDVTHSNAQRIYKALLDQYEGVAQEILDSVDCNDYIKLSKLIQRRKKIQIAIEEMDALYEDSLATSGTLKGHISKGLRYSSQLTTEKGEEVLLTFNHAFKKLNQSTHTIGSKTLDATAKAISFSNQLNHRAGRFLVKHTSRSLSKLADLFE